MTSDISMKMHTSKPICTKLHTHTHTQMHIDKGLLLCFVLKHKAGSEHSLEITLATERTEGEAEVISAAHHSPLSVALTCSHFRG